MATITIYGIKNCDTMKKAQRPVNCRPMGSLQGLKYLLQECKCLWYVPTAIWVLACFNPRWPKLNLGVA